MTILPASVGHLWSIPVEEQFYLIWPLLVLFAAPRKLGVICGMAWILSQCVLIDLCRGHALVEPTIWTNSLVHLQYFALGAGVSLFLKGASPRIPAGGRRVIISSALLLLFLANLVFHLNQIDDLSSITHTYPAFLLAGVATTLLLIGFLGHAAFEKQRVLRYLGKISYGLYAYHVPCLAVVERVLTHFVKTYSSVAIALIGFPLTIAVAAISYRYMERPFLLLKERFEIVKSRVT